MENDKKRNIFQWDLLISGYDLERVVSTKDCEYIICERDGICSKITIKVTNETVLNYFDTDDENLIHGYLTLNSNDEYEALALLDSEMHSLLSNIPIEECIDVLNDYFALNIQDHMSITRQFRNPVSKVYPLSISEYSNRLFYITKFRICKHCYTPAQIKHISELLSVMENRNDALYSVADKKLSYIMRINNYNSRNIFTFKHTVSKKFRQSFEAIQGNEDAKTRIMDLLQAQEYNNQPLFILLAGTGPKSAIARTVAKATRLPISFIQIDNHNNETELLGSENDASIIVKHWQKMGSTDSVIVLNDFDKFALNNPANAYRLMTNFSNNSFYDKFTTAYDTSRSIIIATADEDNLPGQILEKFYIIHTSDVYTSEQGQKIIRTILEDILQIYKIDTYNLDISDETIDEITQTAVFNGFKAVKKNLELLIAVYSTQLKKEVVQITMDDYNRMVYGYAEKDDVPGSKLLRRLFDGIIEE